jgi:hypothetical protein
VMISFVKSACVSLFDGLSRFFSGFWPAGFGMQAAVFSRSE